MQPIIVRFLRVESVSGTTLYAAEGGFSMLTAYVKCDEGPCVVDQLTQAAQDATPVIVRCAALEIEGHVGNLQFSADVIKDQIAIGIEDLRIFKPGN